MLKNKKKLKKAAAFLIGFLLFWRLIIGTFAYDLYATFYPLPRLKCCVTLTVDGEPYRLTGKNVSVLAIGNDVSPTSTAYVLPQKQGGTVGLWGIGYGNHPFEIRIQTEDMQKPLYLPVAPGRCNIVEQANYTMDIEADTAKGTFSYTATRRLGKRRNVPIGEPDFHETSYGYADSSNGVDYYKGAGALQSESCMNKRYWDIEWVYASGA